MSEHKWSMKDNSDSVYLRYSRRMMNNFEGTHLGMSRRWTHKSGPTSTGWCKRWKNIGIIPRKYIIGLLNKFEGKSFNDFVNEFNFKIKDFNGVDKHSYIKYLDCGDYFKRNSIFDEKFIYEPYGGLRPYFVDDEGIIHKREIKIENTKNKGLNKIQLAYNKRLFIPKFGCVRINPIDKYIYQSQDNNFEEKYRNPVYFFDAFVFVNGKVVKLPVYGCNTEIYHYYNYYCNTHPNGKGYYQKSKYSWYINDLRYSTDPKAMKIEDEWVGVPSKNLPGVKTSHHYHIRIKNPIYEKVFQEMNSTKDLSIIQKCSAKLKMLKEYDYCDFGMGDNINYFIKRKDYEKISG